MLCIIVRQKKRGNRNETKRSQQTNEKIHINHRILIWKTKLIFCLLEIQNNNFVPIHSQREKERERMK